MATYTIKTTRTQEIGLKFTYDTYADKTAYPTQAEYFQYRIDVQVTNPMYLDQQRASSVAFDQSFNTIPVTDQPAAKTEIEEVITSHGGTIVVPGPSNPPLPPSLAGRTIPTTRGTDGGEVQAGEASKGTGTDNS